MHLNLAQDMTFIKVLKKIHKSGTSYEANIESILSKHGRFMQLPVHSNGLYYIFDYTQRKYLQLSDSIQHLIGYGSSELLTGGFEKILPLIHKTDFKVFNEKIFPYNLHFLQKQPYSLQPNYVFSHNYRIKSKTGDWLHFYERIVYVTSPTTGLPNVSIGLAINITDFKSDNKIIHRIDKLEPDGNPFGKPLVYHCFYPDAEDCILSTQERRVLNLLSEGLNSREIAERLHLSENTIINHRRNMQTKTNTKNIAELITYACKNRIL